MTFIETTNSTAIANISYEQEVVSPVEQFQFGIVASWRKVASSIMETSRLLLQAEEQLDRAGFSTIRKHLVENGIMSETVISKLLKIARNTVLSAPDNVLLLPGSYATLYVLAGKDPVEVQSALAEGKITPLTQLKDVTDLFPSTTNKVQKVADATGIVVTVQSDLSNVPADTIKAFKAAIDALKEFVSVEVKGL
ncbi:hypothetical protein [Sphingorhabdus sp.]|jgi:hypothetical protein|uniref:hypothetical protein n=1 Tax=Sphingorhabdus sp. TaxID=1902408 RepID=UPI003783BA36